MARKSGENVFRSIYWVGRHHLITLRNYNILFYRPYRAPELLFGTRSYHAKATDLWSLGATLAEFFTPLRLSIIGDDYDDPSDNLDDDGEDDQEMKPFIIPKTLRFGNPNLRWFRQALFNAERGEIGLAWSIFKIRGTPTTEIWPVRQSLYYLTSLLNVSLDIQGLAPFLESVIQHCPSSRSVLVTSQPSTCDNVRHRCSFPCSTDDSITVGSLTPIFSLSRI